MKMIGKGIWWCAIVALIVAFTFAVRFYIARHTVTEDQIVQLGRSIQTDAAKWEGIQIAGENPMMFHKDLTVNHGVESMGVNLMVACAAILMALLLGTAFWQKKLMAPNQVSDATSEPAPNAGSSPHQDVGLTEKR